MRKKKPDIAALRGYSWVSNLARFRGRTDNASRPGEDPDWPGDASLGLRPVRANGVGDGKRVQTMSARTPTSPFGVLGLSFSFGSTQASCFSNRAFFRPEDRSSYVSPRYARRLG